MDLHQQLKTGAAGVALIEKFEGCKLQAYQDVGGIWTIGYGHAHAVKSQYETQAHAEADLCADLGTAESAVNRLVHAPVSQNQFDALVSFTYNEGSGRLAGSTMLRLVNAGDFVGAAAEFKRWDIVGGKVWPGLLTRRNAESDLFLTKAVNA